MSNAFMLLVLVGRQLCVHHAALVVGSLELSHERVVLVGFQARSLPAHLALA